MEAPDLTQLRELHQTKQALGTRCVRINAELRVLLELVRQNSHGHHSGESSRSFLRALELQREFCSLVTQIKHAEQKMARLRSSLEEAASAKS